MIFLMAVVFFGMVLVMIYFIFFLGIAFVIKAKKEREAQK